MTVGLQNLSNQNFYNVKSIVPPMSEQLAIVEFVNNATLKLQESMGAAEREISLLCELRSRLFSDVVTGKLDVREAACMHSVGEPAEESLGDDEAILADEDADEEVEAEEVGV